MKKDTIQEAAHAWVDTFNAVMEGMIGKLMEYEPDEWEEVTPPSVDDRVYVYGQGEGEIVNYLEEADAYMVKLDDGGEIDVEQGDFEVLYDDGLPMWGTMWSFGDSADDYWLEEEGGIQKMADCGFRIYHNDEFGYWFGIDGAGYDFFEEHWVPLYKARGLHWHQYIA